MRLYFYLLLFALISFSSCQEGDKEVFVMNIERSFSIPEDADIENIEAKSENGVLEIFIPKIKKETPKKKITIK
jgi:HSP20 family molecular chaperone IbpA